MSHQIKHRWTNAVLYEGVVGMTTGAVLEAATAAGINLRGASLSGAELRGANLSDADLSDADLRGADLRGANLSDAKNDFWEILLRTPHEIAGLRLALVDGRVDGSTYEGPCACLVGTIANVCGKSYRDMAGIKPNAARHAERWFLAIRKGDTPKTNQISRITVEWLDEFVALLALATAAG